MEILESDIKKKEAALMKSCETRNKTNYISDYYGIGYWLKKYANYPTFLPLYLHCDHGPSIAENLLEYELLSKFKNALLHNSLKLKDAKNRKFKNAFISGSAFVHYRKMNNIKRVNNPKGTVCFPFHSTKNIDVSVDWKSYMEELKKLPEKFHPITICIHYVDIEKGLHQLFLKNGFEVLTAGHKLNVKFVNQFYEILRTKKYSTSNAWGSHVPYSIELGVPFFYTGNGEIEINNRGNTSLKLGKSSFNEYLTTNRNVSKFIDSNKLFKEFSEAVTAEQLEFANTVLGVNDAISPEKLNRILWKEFLTNLHNILGSYLKSILTKNIQFAKRIVKKIKHVSEIKKNI
jgi:hypothetical protein